MGAVDGAFVCENGAAGCSAWPNDGVDGLFPTVGGLIAACPVWPVGGVESEGAGKSSRDGGVGAAGAGARPDVSNGVPELLKPGAAGESCQGPVSCPNVGVEACSDFDSDCPPPTVGSAEGLEAEVTCSPGNHVGPLADAAASTFCWSTLPRLRF